MKAHRTDGVSLTFALIFLAIATWWLFAQLMHLTLPAIGWLVAAGLIGVGALGLVGVLRANRSGRQPATEPAGPTVTEPARSTDTGSARPTGPDRGGAIDPDQTRPTDPDPVAPVAPVDPVDPVPTASTAPDPNWRFDRDPAEQIDVDRPTAELYPRGATESFPRPTDTFSGGQDGDDGPRREGPAGNLPGDAPGTGRGTERPT
ncbi:hypothetical protein ACN28C_10070 [Plantactinospora sp. WMMC1484]|uniref:phage holin family protein n=1 Tax=Plantactinospora sp. WMMC1484 TaxID=3404122 RepID=UPI003BF515BC